MPLSDIASQYLQHSDRDEELVCRDVKKLERFLISQHIPPFKKVIDFQVNFSGLYLFVTENPFSTFVVSLFSREQIETNAAINFRKINDRYYFYCGDHDHLEDYRFVLSDSGEMGVFDDQHNEFSVVYSSIDKFIECYAFEDHLGKTGKYRHPYYYRLLNNKLFEELTLEFQSCFTCSDIYHRWYVKDSLIIQQGVSIENLSAYVSVYGDNEAACVTFINQLRQTMIIK